MWKVKENSFQQQNETQVKGKVMSENRNKRKKKSL